MKQIELSGILWDVENLEVDGKIYFTYEEATELAASLGKRLPTEEELRELFNNSKWDHERNGLTAKGLFFPAAGYRNVDGSINSRGTYGNYWSSSSRSSTSQNAWYLYFRSGYANLSNNYRVLGFSVRLVQDKV